MFIETRAVLIRLERGCHARFDRIQTQQVGGEAVQGPDLRLFQISPGSRRSGDNVVGRPAVAKPQVVNRDRSTLRRRRVPTTGLY
jgi:hypothetical protein